MKSKMNQLSKMLTMMATDFDGMFDKGGKPYVLHLLKVMHYLKSEDEELMCIALGHDWIEDTIPNSDVLMGRRLLKSHGFSDRIIEGIVALTKVPGESYEDYKAKVKANPDAAKVKMADLRHNSDIRRLKGVTPKDIERLIRYNEFYLELQALSS